MDEIHNYLSKKLPKDIIKYETDQYIGKEKCNIKNCYKKPIYLYYTMENRTMKKYCQRCCCKLEIERRRREQEGMWRQRIIINL